MGRRKERKTERAIRSLHVSRKEAIAWTRVVTVKTERNRNLFQRQK